MSSSLRTISAFCPIGEMNDFERVVVWIVEIGAAAGEHAFVALVLPEHIHALGLELGHGRIVGVAVDHEGVVDDVGKPPAAGVAAEDDIVGAGFEEHEMRIFLRHLGHELEAENVGVEGAAAGEVTHWNRHMQNAFGLDNANLLYSDGIRPHAENSPSTAWRKFHARSTQHTEGAISCRTGGQFEVENIAIGGSRTIKDRHQSRMPSR